MIFILDLTLSIAMTWLIQLVAETLTAAIRVRA
jgi:hypothetical protein